MDKKIVIVTGASSGIGRATALFLAQKGYTVYGAARRMERLKTLESQGVKAIALDVTDDSSVNNCVSEVLKNEGRIDVLINNAGYGEYGAIEDVAIENAKQQLEVNVFGLIRMTKAVLPPMRAQRYGKIVNISSIGGKMATPMGGWYHASKFALEGLSDSLRMEVKQFGVDVILIEPGGIKSEWAEIAMKNMLAASQHSVYARMAEKASQFSSAAMDKMPEAIVIAELIKKVIEVKHPKARYAKGYFAKPALFFKKCLSDALFDKIIMSQLK